MWRTSSKRRKRRPPAPDACAGLVSRRFPWTVQGFSAKHRGPLPWTSREENGETRGQKRCRMWGNGGAWKHVLRGGLRRPGSASGLGSCVVGSACGWYVFDQSPRGPAPERRRPWTRSRAQQSKDTAHTTPVVSRRSVGVCAAVANTRNADPPAFPPSRGRAVLGACEKDTQKRSSGAVGVEANVRPEWETPCPDQAWVAEASVSVQRFSSATQEPPEEKAPNWSVRAIPEGRHKSETRSRTMQSHNGEDTTCRVVL